MNGPLLPALPGYDNPQLIAHGTTALVFRAIQTRLNRPVAIKVITVDTGSVPVNAARELATTVALSSQPHIVSIIDTGVTDDDRPYIVMEYCEGGSYAQILRRDGLLWVDAVLEVGVKIGEALHAAHQAGIVHRDVKPSNILRSRFGPALTDFGIARAPDELGGTLTREMMTPHHASPEALLHQAQSGISDIYSLASTMWTLLIGHPPFVDPTKPPLDMYAFRDRVLHDPLPPMTRDDVPTWLIGELGRAMSKLPSQRHSSAVEFAEALRRGALGLSPAPKPTLVLPPAPAAGAKSGAGAAGPTGGPTADRALTGGAPTGGGSTGGGSTGGGSTGGTAKRVHVPGVPAQAWPAPDPTPIGMPPAKATTFRHPAPASAVAPTVAPTVSPAAGPPTAAPLTVVPPGRPPAAPEYRPPSRTQPSRTQPSGTQPAPDLPTPAGPQKSAQSARPGLAPGGPIGPGGTPPEPRPESRMQTAGPETARPEARPEARPDPDEESGGSEEGGWLGPALDWRSAPDPTAPGSSSSRRFDESDLLPPPTGRRFLLLAVLIAVTVLAIAAASGLVMATQGGSANAAQPGVSPSPTVFISAQTEGRPRGTRITEDRGTSVTVSWTDPTAGTVTFVVVGTGPGGEKLETKSIRRGTTTATYAQLSPTKNYCFVVGAVYAVDTIALATEVCTKR